MEEEWTKKYNRKVINAFSKIRWVVEPTNHDTKIILNLMQRMYDCGHADGYADAMRDHQSTNGDTFKALQGNLQVL